MLNQNRRFEHFAINRLAAIAILRHLKGPPIALKRGGRRFVVRAAPPKGDCPRLIGIGANGKLSRTGRGDDPAAPASAMAVANGEHRSRIAPARSNTTNPSSNDELTSAPLGQKRVTARQPTRQNVIARPHLTPVGRSKPPPDEFIPLPYFPRQARPDTLPLDADRSQPYLANGDLRRAADLLKVTVVQLRKPIRKSPQLQHLLERLKEPPS
jgi:hypothetical protein